MPHIGNKNRHAMTQQQHLVSMQLDHDSKVWGSSKPEALEQSLHTTTKHPPLTLCICSMQEAVSRCIVGLVRLEELELEHVVTVHDRQMILHDL